MSDVASGFIDDQSGVGGGVGGCFGVGSIIVSEIKENGRFLDNIYSNKV
jgi:hypothetical protein